MRALDTAAQRLARAVDEIDALNVYPLPDGDTGRNMRRTLEAAIGRARGSEDHAGRIWVALADGALRGAHGNSGVILSQILRGFADTLGGADAFDAAGLREALAHGAQTAGAAITRPARGTMLTFCEDVSRAAAIGGDDVVGVLGAAMGSAAGALERTRSENAMNEAAGVVDAGAYGLWLLLAGAHEMATGVEHTPPRLRRAGMSGVAVAAPDGVASWSGGSCVQYIVATPTRAVADLRAELEASGADSVLVVGDASLLKVHAHSSRPETVIAVGRSAGVIEDLVLEDFDAMVAEHERATGIVLASPPRELAAVAVVPGPGIAAAFRSLGVTPVRGAAGANPSVGELADAISRTNARRVVLLTNDQNAILAAREAAKLASCAVDLIETTNVAQAIAALPYFEPQGTPDEVVGAMREAAAGAHSVEVTRATRDACIDGIEVRSGDAIGLVDGRVLARADDAVDALVLATRALDGVGILTLFTGAGVDEATAARAAALLREAHPDAELEVRDGGQPHYPFIVAAE